MSAKIAAVVTYQNATTDIAVEYDSKNKLPVETVTIDDSTGIIVQVDYNKAFTDSVTLAEEILVAAQYNLAITDSISSTEAFSWTTTQNFTESITTGDTPGIGQIHHVNPTDSAATSDVPGIGNIHHINATEGISVSDSLVFFHDGMLNTNMLNTRLISVGSQEVTGDDISITIT